jgi:hypothetical protein
MAQHLAQRTADARGGQRRAARRGQGLRLAQSEPEQGNHPQQEQHDENSAPVGDLQDDLAQDGRQDRHQDKDHRNEGHHPSHGAALVAIANQRHGDAARRGHADALQEPPCQHHGKGEGEDRQQGADEEDGIAQIDGRLAAHAV